MKYKRERKDINIDIKNEVLRGEIKAILSPMIGLEQNVVELMTKENGLKVMVEGEEKAVYFYFENVSEYIVVDRFGFFYTTYNESFRYYYQEDFNNILYSVKKNNGESAFLVVTENYFIEITADNWELCERM